VRLRKDGYPLHPTHSQAAADEWMGHGEFRRNASDLLHEDDGEYLAVGFLVGGFSIVDLCFHAFDVVAGIDASGGSVAKARLRFVVVVVEERDGPGGIDELQLEMDG